MKPCLLLWCCSLTLPLFLSAQPEQKFYNYQELAIFLQGWEIHTPYEKEAFLEKIEKPYTDFQDTTPELYAEFGYDIYVYFFHTSFLEIRDGVISDMVLNDDTLAVDGIRVGDPIEKVEAHYKKYNYGDQRITIWDGDFPLTYSYNLDRKITMISYHIPL